MKLSVVILNYNVRYFLELCLQSVEAALVNIPSEIIVIDNNSKDGSCAMVKENFPSVVIIENNSNVGFSKANNQAVKIAKGEYVCILNPDTVVAEDTFESILEFANQQTNLGIIGCRLVDGLGVFLPESKRNIPIVKIAIKKILGNSKAYYASHVKEHETAKVEVLVGAFMVLKRSLYNSLEGFDEDYFMYGEDIDFSYKSLKKGYDNYYFGNTSVIHYKGESTRRNDIYLKRFYGAMQIFYKKHFKSNFFYDFLVSAVIKSLVRLKPLKRQQPEVRYKSVLISSNPEAELVKKLNSSLIASTDELSPNSELIFDATTLSFKSIIDLMQDSKLKPSIFKIQPKNCSYILGSNSADSLGEVIQF
ncbi:MAG: glycosyltransferase family 2 protein [Flavobacteriaceae bacterium]|nr:glycosyltransferase family 2 protein [Flavobacteriaceae bacterium]